MELRHHSQGIGRVISARHARYAPRLASHSGRGTVRFIPAIQGQPQLCKVDSATYWETQRRVTRTRSSSLYSPRKLLERTESADYIYRRFSRWQSYHVYHSECCHRDTWKPTHHSRPRNPSNHRTPTLELSDGLDIMHVVLSGPRRNAMVVFTREGEPADKDCNIRVFVALNKVPSVGITEQWLA